MHQPTSNAPARGVVGARRTGTVVAVAAALVLSITALAVTATGTTAAAASTDGLTWTDNGTNVTITGCDGTCPSPLDIPATIDVGSATFLPVTSIGDNAFTDQATVDGVTVPDGVTSIGAQAFQATALTSVVLPPSLVEVGQSAFSSITSLEFVRFLGEAPALGGSAFAGSTGTVYRSTGANGWSEVPNPLDGLEVVGVDSPEVTSEPTSQSVEAGDAAEFTVIADAGVGGGELTYQWRKNSVPLEDELGPTLRFASATYGDAGTYDVAVTGWAGRTVSYPATLTVNEPTPTPPPTSPPPQSPAPTPTVPTKTDQAAAVSLPKKLKRTKKYALPTATNQGQSITWSVKGNSGCKIKKNSKLVCKKNAPKKPVKIRAAAAGTDTLNTFAQTYKRKVK